MSAFGGKADIGLKPLLRNTLPTGAILTVLILTFGPVSGAHFNPAVSVAMALCGELWAWPNRQLERTIQKIGTADSRSHPLFSQFVFQSNKWTLNMRTIIHFSHD